MFLIICSFVQITEETLLKARKFATRTDLLFLKIINRKTNTIYYITTSIRKEIIRHILFVSFLSEFLKEMVYGLFTSIYCFLYYLPHFSRVMLISVYSSCTVHLLHFSQELILIPYILWNLIPLFLFAISNIKLIHFIRFVHF